MSNFLSEKLVRTVDHNLFFSSGVDANLDRLEMLQFAPLRVPVCEDWDEIIKQALLYCEK